MHWLLIGYMFLFVHRPFEVWPELGDLRIERIYMLVTLVVWSVSPGKRWLGNPLHGAFAGFALAVLFAWVMSPWMEKTQPVVEDYFKILVFYLLLVTTVHDEKGLKRVVLGLLGVMGVYLAHSLREYTNGRHTYRMGIARMIGVDSSAGDPNSFGASIVFVLPFVVAVWRTGLGGRLMQFALSGYTLLSIVCILLTGSRSSLLGLGVWAAFVALRGKHRWKWVAVLAVAAPLAFLVLPEELQTRFETIVNPDAGPANAKESGEGRVQGFYIGLELWGDNPISGIGPGAWRPATKSQIESHNLIGQLVGELGTLGLLGFLAVLGSFYANWRAVAAVRKAYPEWQNEFPVQVASAVGTAVLLLLFMGCFGHNLFRYSWLWYGGFLAIARRCLAVRVREWEYDCQFVEVEEPMLEPGWTLHSGHEESTPYETRLGRESGSS